MILSFLTPEDGMDETDVPMSSHYFWPTFLIEQCNIILQTLIAFRIITFIAQLSYINYTLSGLRLLSNCCLFECMTVILKWMSRYDSQNKLLLNCLRECIDLDLQSMEIFR